MGDTNCTVYLDERKVRGKIGSVSDHGLNVSISPKDYTEYTGKEIAEDKTSVTIPGFPSYLIAIDDSVKFIEEVVSNRDLTIDSIRTIEHSVSNFHWHRGD